MQNAGGIGKGYQTNSGFSARWTTHSATGGIRNAARLKLHGAAAASLVRSRNSSGGLYRCRRRSAHDRRRTNAMRFLMKTIVVRPTPRLIHAFPQKPFWMRSGPAAAFAPSARPRSANVGDWPSTNRAHRPFGKSPVLLLKAVAAAIRPLQILPRPGLHLIAHRTFPIH